MSFLYLPRNGTSKLPLEKLPLFLLFNYLMWVAVLEFSRKTEAVRDSYLSSEREMYFKELVYVIIKPGKSKICKVSWQAGDPGKEGSLN